MKKKVKKEKIELKEKVFHIPQIVKISGLRQSVTFKSEHAISPFSGRQVKDGFVPQEVLNETDDVDQRYDAYRKVKRISKDDLVAKYGTKYVEFTNIHTNKAREEFLGEKVYGETDTEPLVTPTQIKPITNSFANDSVADELNFATDSSLNFQNINKTLSEMENNDFKEYLYTDIPDYLKPETVEPKPIIDSQKASSIKPENTEVSKTYSYTDRPQSLNRLPSYDFFTKSELNLKEKPQWVNENINQINDTLREFGLDGYVKETIKGPTVTRYEIELEKGINVKKILNIKDNLMMGLKVHEIRIQTPIPGKEYVGIEIPNKEKEIVYFGNCVNNDEFNNVYSQSQGLKVVLGLDVDGEFIYANITQMPHCLIAGATNSGKSVCVNSILISLLLKNTADDLRLILIDPKIVELNAYDGLPHLITPVITKPEIAAGALNWAVEEMERRYNTLAEMQVKDIKSYNERVLNGEIDGAKMPYIVIVIDELSDLMITTANEVEVAIQRLTAKARAAGIHLIVATQRPTTDVIKGVIKANITTRIAFKVAAHVDSSVILDEAGAENLLGMGDMLYKSNERVMRLQGAYISDEEIRKAVAYIKQNEEPNYIFDHTDILMQNNNYNQVDENLFERVALYIVKNHMTSLNAICREFSIGYNKAQKTMTALEQYGIVSAPNGNKPREVLVTLAELKDILNYKN